MRHIHLTLFTTLLMLCTAMTQAATVGQHRFAAHSVLSEGRWVRVAFDTPDDGIRQITYSQLSKMGFSHPERVGVFGFGGHALPEDLRQISQDDLPEVAVWHDHDRQRILFFARGTLRWDYTEPYGFVQRQNASETQSFYFLTEKAEGEPRGLDTLAVGTPTRHIVTASDEHLLHEAELINLGGSGKELYGESFLSVQSQRFSLAALDAGQVRIQVNFAALSKTGSSAIAVRLNDQPAGSGTIEQATSEYAFANEVETDETLTLTRADALNVSLTYTPPSTGSATRAHLNYIRVQGKRAFSTPHDFTLIRSIEALGTAVTYDLTAALTEGIVVWDVTDPADIRVQLTSEDCQFSPTQPGLREYALVNTRSDQFGSPATWTQLDPQDLHGLPLTDMVIVTAPAYTAQAQRLADYRQLHDGLHVTVVTPEQIYNEFASGCQDVTAIRLFLKMFYDRYQTDPPDTTVTDQRQLRYLLLLGDGYYDNRAIDRNRYLPVYETDASLNETSSTVCDDYFGFLDDDDAGRQDSRLHYTIQDGTLDIGVGRLTASTPDEATALVSKVIGYSDNQYLGAWKNRLCFLSDDDKAGDTHNAHIRHNEQLIRSLEQAGQLGFLYQKIYLPAYERKNSASGTDYPEARKELNETLKQGVLMLNYAGHGSTTAITNENLMDVATASQLNSSYLPLWITATCDVSRWDAKETSLGEALLHNPNGGAIALISTTRVVYAAQNLQLNQAITDHLFDRFDDGTRYRLGDIIKEAKRRLGNDYNKLNFCLLGDPSLTLAYPEQQIEVTKVNGQPTLAVGSQQPNFSFHSLQEVTLEGRVLRTGSHTETDETFNGLIYTTLYDAPDTLLANRGYVQDPSDVVAFSTRTRKAFSGRAYVQHGTFGFTFTLPQDLETSPSNGLANFYACGDEGEEAQGYFDHYRLVADTTSGKGDGKGPEIVRLFLNNELWGEGDKVNATPFLYAEMQDESGINVTGNGIGHDLTLTLRCLSNPLLTNVQYILNDYFSTFTGNAHRGHVQYSIPTLADGTYEATLRVWDLCNNMTQQTFTFTVDARTAPETLVVQAYPSPAKVGQSLTFRVLHNRPESAQELHLQVYSQTGYKVYETTVRSASAAKFYAKDAEHQTEPDTATDADQTGYLLGSSQIQWTAPDLRPGFYVYRIELTSGDSYASSDSKILLVHPE